MVYNKYRVLQEILRLTRIAEVQNKYKDLQEIRGSEIIRIHRNWQDKQRFSRKIDINKKLTVSQKMQRFTGNTEIHTNKEIQNKNKIHDKYRNSKYRDYKKHRGSQK